jgi:hypothetical protein
MSPEEMLAEVIRHSRFSAEEFRGLAMEKPLDMADLHRRIRSMIEGAEHFISQVPSDEVGFVFLECDTPVQPETEAFDKYTRRSGSRRGVWPSSSEIANAMLDRYTNPPGA